MEWIDWGNVPAWLGSLFTGISVAALVRAQLRDRAEAKVRQARLVRMLVAREPAPTDQATGYPVVYDNYSDETIIDLVFTTKWGDTEQDEMHSVVSALGPRSHGLGAFVSLGSVPAGRPRCWMRFTDSAGNYWHLEGTSKARALTNRERAHYEKRISLAFDPTGPTWYQQPYHHDHAAEPLFDQPQHGQQPPAE